MSQTIRVIRLFFFALCMVASYLVALVVPEWDGQRWVALAIGALLGGFVILVDVLLRGFSLRGLSALSFGLFVGWLMATLISSSPLFEIPMEAAATQFDAVLIQNSYLIRLGTFLVLMYLCAVVALRGRDEFNLVIPYIKFEPHGVEIPLAVVDSSALIDGRIVGICESKFMGYALVVPRFVLEELQRIADSNDTVWQIKGRRGLDNLNRLRGMPHLDLRVNESSVASQRDAAAKLVFLAQSLKARLLTTDYNLAQVAEFHDVEWLNLSALDKALHPIVAVGEMIEVELVKAGKEREQAVGYLSDGSMVVVTDGRPSIGRSVEARVESIVPSAGGRMIFASLHRESRPPFPAGTALPRSAIEEQV